MITTYQCHAHTIRTNEFIPSLVTLSIKTPTNIPSRHQLTVKHN
jgi:hypothetical protein